MSAQTEKTQTVSFAECLFGDDPEQLAREHRVRREALALSITFQLALVAALVLLPLFDIGGKLPQVKAAPKPPYVYVDQRPSNSGPTNPVPPVHPTCIICTPTSIPPNIPPVGDEPRVGTPSNPNLGPGKGFPARDEFVPIPGTGPGTRFPVQPPQPERPTVQATQRIRVTTIELAMLLRRVEPVYPVLALQIRREGRVELRAIVATDGTIQSLEFAGGDPLFFQSAREAVSQWRYRATVLNGVPVEVETHIIVIYQMQH